METKLNLDVHAILDKEFHVDFKGYSASEVDALLDLVIEDYQIYDQMIAKMSEAALVQERTIASLKAKIIELEGKQKAMSESESMNVSQMDILKRLSRLEQIVYQEKN
ncbi:MAG: DivIVA domain-containing protein [Erysipelotrichaceae bacterium]|nr:DivIVA domain-containing protein [Erysipelotrichaceae bacterium]